MFVHLFMDVQYEFCVNIWYASVFFWGGGGEEMHKKSLFVLFGSFCFTDCFQTSLIEEFPDLSTELLHILGAIISGAQVSECLYVCSELSHCLCLFTFIWWKPSNCPPYKAWCLGLWLTHLHLFFLSNLSSRTVCKIRLLEDGPNLMLQNVC